MTAGRYIARMSVPAPVARRAHWVELDVEVPSGREDGVTAALWMCGTTGAWTVRPGVVRAYFDGEAEGVNARFRAAWRETTGEEWQGTLAARLTADHDWLARWRAGVEPVAVTPTLWVTPPGTGIEDGEGVSRRVVVIQPGQGFGTGSHPTTQALLRWIEAGPGERVLDVGCGSGVLGIAALVLGARLAVGLDVDGDAIANADENRRLNRVTGRMCLVRGSLDALAGDTRFDRVLANLDGRTLEGLTGSLLERCGGGGRLGVAGLLVGERGRFLGWLRGWPVEIVDERIDEDAAGGDVWWSAWLARRGGS